MKKELWNLQAAQTLQTTEALDSRLHSFLPGPPSLAAAKLGPVVMVREGLHLLRAPPEAPV